MIESLEMLPFINIIKIAFNLLFCTIHLFIYESHCGFWIWIY